MRQAQKQEILSFIDSLQQAHGEIKGALEKKDKASAQNMLAECQEFAVELGNAIEKTEGEDCITVSYIEAYCEILFSIFKEISLCEEEKIIYEANKVFKSLKKSLLRVENSVKNDISTSKEVVFFPYKASMWDSLESVYLAAKEDPDCDVYCVPIPYFELNADHSFGKMHYEGREYPENIEIIDWQSYHLEERKPDIIFIHNPYDEWNHVTSVHPMYYAKNLKKYTDCLVYIPYFILGEVKQEDKNRQKRIEKIKHFCFLPGTIYADKVIVQSEDMRQIYITEYMKEVKQLNISVGRSELETKILGIGSPKIEKIENTKIDNLKIPNGWLNIIQKADGERKKVIFYNLGVSALLEYGEKWICKIKDTLSIFKQNQESVAVLWRPHPLIENTLISMRPELLEQYVQIRNAYIDEGWGIYDDTPDLDRAIILSDAYYGDGSSVAGLFRQMKKTVMQQNVDIQCTSLHLGECIEEKEIFTTEGTIFNNYIYFVANYILIGAIMRIDMRTWEVSYVNDIANYYPDKVSIVGMMVREADTVYCLRLDGEMITVFDLSNNVCDYIDTGFKGENWGNFVAFKKYGKFLYLFAAKDSFVIKINIETKELEKIYFDKNSGSDEHKNFYSAACVIEETVWLFSESKNEAVVYNMVNDQWNIYSIPIEASGCCFAVYYENSIFLLDTANRVFQWKPEEQQLIKLWENELYYGRKYYFGNIVVTPQNIILLPRLGDEILIIDRENCAEKIYDEYPKEFQYMASEESAKYVDGCEDENYYYYLIFSANHILRIGKANGDINWIKPKLPTKEEKYFFASEKYEIVTEEMIELKYYIHNIPSKKCYDIMPSGNIGEKIWDAIR